MKMKYQTLESKLQQNQQEVDRLKESVNVKSIMLDDQNKTLDKLKKDNKDLEKEFKKKIDEYETMKMDYKDEVGLLQK
eukprot:UN33790